MSVRKTETRIPQGLQPSDLGEAILNSDGKCSLISFITAPLAAARENMYVVFVMDTALASSTVSFEWSFIEDSRPPTVKTSEIGQQSYTPLAEGFLNLKVRLLDGSSSEVASLAITQEIGPLNIVLEEMIAKAVDKPGPTMSNVEVIREVVNDHNPYYKGVSLKTPESGNSFLNFLFSMTNDGVLQRSAAERKSQLELVANSINNGETDFVSVIGSGLGVCGLRMLLLTMLLSPSLLPYQELPEPTDKNMIADAQIRQKLAALSESDRIDLFNVLRFPKTNIKACGQVLEALRDRFFSGVNFNDVLTKMSGAMGDWILLNYQKGPLHRN